MSYSTYVYAMVGIHCKDVITTTKNRERGCNHAETTDNFCPECGKTMWETAKTVTRLSDQLEHLQEWNGDEDSGEFFYEDLSMIYSPMTGPTDFMVGRVLGEFDTDDEGMSKDFHVLEDYEYDAVKAETQALLEPLGLWDEDTFGYRLYSIAV